MPESNRTKAPRRTSDQWQAIVTDFLASDFSAPKYCQQKNISYASFSKWRQRFSTLPPRSDEQGASFIDVSALMSEKTHWNITLKLGNGVELVLNQA